LVALFGEDFRRCTCGHYEFEQKVFVTVSKGGAGVIPLRVASDEYHRTVVIRERYSFLCAKCGKELAR